LVDPEEVDVVRGDEALEFLVVLDDDEPNVVVDCDEEDGALEVPEMLENDKLSTLVDCDEEVDVDEMALMVLVDEDVGEVEVGLVLSDDNELNVKEEVEVEGIWDSTEPVALLLAAGADMLEEIMAGSECVRDTVEEVGVRTLEVLEISGLDDSSGIGAVVPTLELVGIVVEVI
jgi:hypothetical protein